MKVKVFANTSAPVAIPGLGLIEPNTWVDVDKEQARRFELFTGKSLKDASIRGRFEVKEKEKKKEAN